jgi:hypothetical protein
VNAEAPGGGLDWVTRRAGKDSRRKRAAMGGIECLLPWTQDHANFHTWVASVNSGVVQIA